MRGPRRLAAFVSGFALYSAAICLSKLLADRHLPFNFTATLGGPDSWTVAMIESILLALPLFMSNCGAAQRLRAIESLVQQGSVEVHAFGACVPEGVQRGELALEYPECFGQPRRSAMWDAQKECVLFRAMFSLDLENSLENGYITEKVYLYLYLYLSICSV